MTLALILSLLLPCSGHCKDKKTTAPAAQRQDHFQTQGSKEYEFFTDSQTEEDLEKLKVQQKAETQDKSPKAQEAIQREIVKLDAGVTNRLAQTPPDSPQYFSLANSSTRFSIQKGDFKTAMNRAENNLGLAQASNDPKKLSAAYDTRAMAYYAQGDFASADRDALEAMRQNPKNRSAHAIHMLAQTRVPPDAGRIAELLAKQNPLVSHTPEQWEAAMQANPTPAYEVLKSAARSRRKGDFAAALGFANQAVALDPNVAMAYAERGVIYNDLHRYTEAMIDLSRAINKGWDSDVAYLLRAKSLYNNKQYAAALHDAVMAAAANPKQPAAYHALARAAYAFHEQQGDLLKFEDPIMADLKTALSLEPTSALYKTDLENLTDGFRHEHQVSEAKDLEESQRREAMAREEQARRETEANRRRWLLGLAAATIGAVFLFLIFLFPRRKKSAVKAPDWSQFSVPSLVAGTYRIVRRIGEGGMGEVYEALDIKLNRQVALKRANADHNGDPEERKHFISEAQIAASLKHSNIMTVYALAEEAGQFYHVCELLEGKTAAHILLRNGPLTIQQCLPIVRDVCAALSYAHSKGVIHRDLKPANIMIENASAKIMDFGISRRTKSLDCRTQTLCVAGTPAYMAPEEDIGEISLQSDIYSWAVSIYELLTGQLPFAGTGARENKRAGRFMSVSSFQPKLACLDEFFKKALHPSPSQRFHDAQEFCQAFFEAAKKYEQLK